jgi:hypothetical protein
MDAYLQLLNIVLRDSQNRTALIRHDDLIITSSVTALSAKCAREDFGTNGQRWKAKAGGNRKPLSAFCEESSVIPTERRYVGVADTRSITA